MCVIYNNFFNSFSKSSTSKNLRNTEANRIYATLSIFFKLFATWLPIWVLVTSVVSPCFMVSSIRARICSIFSIGNAVFSVDLSIPLSNFSRLNRSRRPSRLITTIGTCSVLSYVVNRLEHLMHSLRRRTVDPSSDGLVSTTSVSFDEQNKHLICGVGYHPRAPPGESQCIKLHHYRLILI